MIYYTQKYEKRKGVTAVELMKEADFRKALKNGLGIGYLFFGDEDYLKHHALASAREALCPDPSLAFFNDLRIDALGYTPEALADALMPMPMMADRKLITLSGLNLNVLRPSELEALCDVLSTMSEYDYNTLIITVSADGLDPGYLPKKPSATLKALSEHLIPVQFDRCSTAKLATWVQKHFLHHGVTASSALCGLVPDYCGHSMYTLSYEIEKLAFYTRYHGRSEATEADLRRVCTPASEYDSFAFTDAIMEGNNDRALSILADYRFRRVDPIIALSEVSKTICEMVAVKSMTEEGYSQKEIGAAVGKLHEYRVGLYQRSLRRISPERLLRALSACAEADASLKLSTGSGYLPLERLICSL